MIRLLALDLDGTLVRKDGSYDPRDLAAVAEARSR
jgi:hydroxymethylpyrimidine pyrophosphatase-like HAD family hydrolase